jgi:methyl-accepting chemotaxis protein
MSANALIKTVIALLAAAVVVLLAASAWDSWRRLSTVGQIARVAEISGDAFKAMHNMRTDRSTTSRELNAPEPPPPDVMKRIQEFRDVEMSALRRALPLLATLDFPDKASLLPALQRNFEVLERLQKESIEALARPKAARRDGLAREYLVEGTTLIELLEKIATRLTGVVKFGDAFIDQMLAMKQLAWAVRNSGGEASLLIANGLAAGKVAPEAALKYAGHVGGSEVAWAALEDMASGGGLPPKLVEAIGNAKRTYFAADYIAKRDQLLKTLIEGGKPDMTANQWSPYTVGRLAQLLVVAEQALDAAKAHAAAQYSAAQIRLGSQIAFLFLALVVAGGAMLVVSRRVIRPLHAIKEAMLKVAAGDLTADVSFADRRDEIGALAGALGTFKGNAEEKTRIEAEQRTRHAQATARQDAVEGHIRAFENQMRTALEALGGASGQMRTTSDGLTHTAEQTNRQVRVVATASEEASSNVQTVASASEQLASSIAEISQSVAKAASIAGRAVEEARETDVTIQGLTEAAGKIGEVVKLINNIAGQTNLLALNATIEAARAGEAGKGFAVVASEVKSLANQTAKATEDISAQIAAVQNVTRETVEAIKRIGGTIGEVSQVATSIASAVEQQGAATQEITRSTQQAARLTKDVLENVSGVTSGADATGSAAQGVKSAAEGLGRQAEQLRHQVDDFLRKIRTA